MRIVFLPRTKGHIEYGIIYGCIALIALVTARFIPLLSLLPDCTFKRLTGFPCPTCGATHAMVSLVHGDTVAAFFSNPLVTLLMLIALPAFLFNLLAVVLNISRVTLTVTEKERVLAQIGAALLFIIHWIYLASVA